MSAISQQETRLPFKSVATTDHSLQAGRRTGSFADTQLEARGQSCEGASRERRHCTRCEHPLRPRKSRTITRAA